VALPTEKKAQQFVLNVLVGFVPAVVLGLLFGKAIKANLFTPVVVASTFIIGGFIILWAEKRQQNNPAVARIQEVDDMTVMDALKVGLVQCLAMIPGTSRSGATIIGGMLLGLSRKAATDFSLLPGHAHADRRGRLQPLQGTRAAVDGRPADVRGRPGVFLLQRLALRALAAALHLEPTALCRLPGTASPSASWCWRARPGAGCSPPSTGWAFGADCGAGLVAGRISIRATDKYVQAQKVQPIRAACAQQDVGL
jgi:hypothetical protein